MKINTLSTAVMIAAAAFAAFVTGCGNKPDDGSATIDAAAANAAQQPSVFAEPEPEPEPDIVLTYKLKSAEDAIAYMDSSAYASQYAEGILHRMAADNLDYTERLLRSPYNYFVVVDKPSMFVVLFDRFGREVKAYKMACSKRYGTKHKRRDNRTPEGFFSADGIYDSTEWLYTDDDGNTSQVKGQFGPRFIRLKTDVTKQVGIHGTCAPWSLGRRASHGCIRIHNDNILDLVKYVVVGTPIIVNPSEADQKVNREEDCVVPTINIGKPVHEQVPAPEEKKEESKEKQAADTPAAVTPVPAPDMLPDTIASDSDMFD